VLIAGENSGLNLATVFRQCFFGLCTQIGILFDERGAETVEEGEHIVQDQNLAVAAAAGADTDGRNIDRLTDFGGNFSGNALNDQGKGPGFGHGQGILHKPLFSPLDFETAELIDRLRS